MQSKMDNNFYFIIKAHVLLLLITYSCTIETQKSVKYQLSSKEYENQELFAIIGTEEFILIPEEKKLCLSIEKVKDFDSDGFEEIVVKIVNGCGGNCCANSYQLFSYNGKEFIKTPLIGWDWNGIEIKDTPDGYRFIIEERSEGVGNNDRCTDKVETYLFDEKTLKLVSTKKDRDLECIKELTSKDFIGKEFEKLHLDLDIDGDGKMDRVSSEYWLRWGRMANWSIKFGNGKTFSDISTPKRIGFLATKTNGVYDLVLECETVFVWNGETYKKKQ